ncbi:MAG: HAMP domain-containing histidine kinase [Lachnospiraceae bacterium]|nr:HAMP domain-containing histidine kinase [Lachnospiraceae bacterium]
MKLKTKLMVAFCCIILVPVLLGLIFWLGFHNIQIKNIQKTYGLENDEYQYLMNPIQLLNHYTSEIYEELQEVAETSPERLEDRNYLEEINRQLQERYSFLLVRKGETFIYAGAEDALDVMEDLPEYQDTQEQVEAGIYLEGQQQILIKQLDFTCADGSAGTVFLISRSKDVIPELKEVAVDIAISMILILVLTACILTIWIYSSMIIPIKKLEQAAQNIKEGNLDFTVDVNGKDEIGELGQNFEEMRQRLKESAEEKLANEAENRDLISNIAHDLKTPITAIKGYSEGIMDGVADTPEKKNKYIRTIYNKANEMETLINELTLYSNIETNRIPYNFNKINVKEYFEDCTADIGLELEAKNIGLSYFDYADDDIRIIADPEQLRRVIQNIVSNSVKYLDKQRGFINIRIKDVGDFIQVEIEDNGKGIAQKDLPYIFERFFRADTSRNSAAGGSGIGLSIVKKIIEDHGGKIWATSEESMGTVMYFVLRKYQEAFHNE